MNTPSNASGPAIDINREHLLSLTEASKRLPIRRRGKRPHVHTLYRWSTRGCRGVVLGTIDVGGTRCTSIEELQRFFQSVTRRRLVMAAPAEASEPREEPRPLIDRGATRATLASAGIERQSDERTVAQ